jgi:aryl-alcohol dehydrogenase-like predicted oxidoreductase
MQTRILGHSGIGVSALGFGCMGLSWLYGDAPSEKDATAVLHRALDLGVTFFDTADVYGPYTNEELVGRALRGKRDRVIIATKCGLVVKDAARFVYDRNGRPEHITESCDASLKRLGIDVIDLYYLHRPDPNVPIEDSIGAMADLVRAGKIRAVGVSECDLPTLQRAYATYPITAVQSELSLWTRDVLPEILPWCKAHQIAFVPFSPLGRGFLTGKYTSSEQFGENDFRANNPRFQAEAIRQNLTLIERIKTVAERLNATTGQVAIAWVMAQGEQVVPIPGTKRLAYLEENAGAAKVHLNGEDMALLNDLPAAAGTRY